MTCLVNQAQHCREWLTRQALPLWLSQGYEEPLFAEGLYQDGTPYQENVRRFRVQPRQIYVFSHATQLGLIDARAALNNCVSKGLPLFYNSRHEYLFSIDDAFQPQGHSANAYEHAFALLGFAWHYHLTLNASSLERMEQIYLWFEQNLTASGKPGYYTSTTSHSMRSQNPHMHLFEALMVSYELTDDSRWLERAGKLYRLFRQHILQSDCLGEFFTADWGTNHPFSDRVDPGHHYEWIWLLCHYQKLTHTKVSDALEILEHFAARHGHNPNGLVRDEVLRDGSALRPTSRLWCQTEYLKAQLALYENTKEVHYREKACLACERIFNYYLNPAPTPGAWLDHLDESGQPLHSNAPASTFYHLFLAFSELMRVADKESL